VVALRRRAKAKEGTTVAGNSVGRGLRWGIPVVRSVTAKDAREAAKANELRPLHC